MANLLKLFGGKYRDDQTSSWPDIQPDNPVFFISGIRPNIEYSRQLSIYVLSLCFPNNNYTLQYTYSNMLVVYAKLLDSQKPLGFLESHFSPCLGNPRSTESPSCLIGPRSSKAEPSGKEALVHKNWKHKK